MTGDMERIKYFACYKCEGKVRQNIDAMVAASAVPGENQDTHEQP